MICPKCHKGKLHDDDEECFVCYECGTAFSLEEGDWLNIRRWKRSKK